ncbi:MAG TPA: hypothetical protein VGQ96_01575, partial [Candidatus Eremiobacteraceae bacterium]|nr:hypothetical protein [Candidatus Eremiobacteraceae bacterium]
MLLFHWQLDEFGRSGNVNEFVAVQIFALDAEQHVAIARGHGQHHGRGLAGAESVFVDDDLDPVV